MASALAHLALRLRLKGLCVAARQQHPRVGIIQHRQQPIHLEGRQRKIRTLFTSLHRSCVRGAPSRVLTQGVPWAREPVAPSPTRCGITPCHGLPTVLAQPSHLHACVCGMMPYDSLAPLTLPPLRSPFYSRIPLTSHPTKHEPRPPQADCFRFPLAASRPPTCCSASSLVLALKVAVRASCGKARLWSRCRFKDVGKGYG